MGSAAARADELPLARRKHVRHGFSVRRLLVSALQWKTFSAGIAVWNGAETADQLVARADAALYEAKAGGRNRVTAVVDGSGEMSYEAA